MQRLDAVVGGEKEDRGRKESGRRKEREGGGGGGELKFILVTKLPIIHQYTRNFSGYLKRGWAYF